MSEPTDPREIRHNAGMVTHQTGSDARLNTTIDPSQLPQHDYGAHRFGSDLRNLDPQTIRENHMRTMLPRTQYDRDQDRQLRAQAALKRCAASAHAKESMINRCVSIIRSLEHMEVDKDIALIALEALSEGQE